MLLESECLPRVTVLLVMVMSLWMTCQLRAIILSLTQIDTPVCGTESMQFTSFYEGNETAHGNSFTCDLMRYLDEWKISNKFSYKFNPIEESEVVFVTYSSSNHFAEARQGIRSWRAAFNNTIIFYDLGLKKSEVNELHNVCNLEVRKLDFNQFPHFVSNLMGYHFKAIIMAEVFSEFEHYWIVDTSVRFFNRTHNLEEFYNNITSGVIEPLAMRKPTIHSIFAATHPTMYTYLPIDMQLSKEFVQLAAGLIFISSSELAREAVKWNVLCALTADCMAPPGSSSGCNFGDDRYNTYANCHRYTTIRPEFTKHYNDVTAGKGWVETERQTQRQFHVVLHGREKKTW